MQKVLYELTNPQKSIWFTEEFYKGTPIENITGTVIISKKVNFSLLDKAINIFVAKNDSFRLKFLIENKKVMQYVEKYSQAPIEIINVASEEELKNVEKNISSTVFNTLNSFLYIFKIVRFPDGHGGFIINMHHLISDAWSSGIGGSEIIKIYTHLLKNEPIDNITYPSYIDYITSEQTYLTSDKFNKDKLFWNAMFDTVPEIATIPSSGAFTQNNLVGTSNRLQFTLPKALISTINTFCKEYKISIFNFLMAVFSIYIGKTAGLDEFVIGTPVLNRGNIKEKNTSGMFISTVPLKIKLKEASNFIALATNIASDFFSIFKHHKYPYLSLLEDLRHKDNTIPNLYNILISYQNIRSTAKNSETPYNIKWVPNNYTSDSMDIHIYDMNDTGNINIAYDYQLSKYSKQDIENIHSRILNIINEVLKDSNIYINNLEIVTPEEKQQLLRNFNDTYLYYDKTKTISMLFEEQVEKTPNNIAVVFEDKKLTYRELDKKSNSLAHYLRNKGIGRNDLVGIMVNRSLEMIISILAVLKAGGAYIPIDPEYPQDRIEYMLNNSNAKQLLTHTSLKNNVEFDNIICVDLDNKLYNTNTSKIDNINQANDIAYTIYTSGSTGLPKGVTIKHRNVVNLIYGMQEIFHFTSDTCIISVTTISFDIFVLESLMPLSIGMKIVIASEEAQTNANIFNNICTTNNVDIIQTTPSRLQAFLFDETFSASISNVKYLLIGGEPFPAKLLEKLHKIYNGKIYNMYGPTETTVWSSVKDLSQTDDINIGIPISNTQIYILNKDSQLVPPTSIGEIYIAGDGVGKGYLNKQELTEKSFIHNPFINNTLMYKTGDLGYFKPNGEIVCLGRCDNQVKIRGLRVELGEIEACIEEYPSVTRCMVAFTNQQKLVAYFSSEKTINTNDLKVFLQRKLPAYFVPDFFVKIDKFKFTPNGKIDRKATAKLKIPTTSIVYEAPKTKEQEQLVKMFKNVLSIQKVGINDNFFDIGGDSLSAIKLQIEALNNGLNISYKDIFSYPTIKLLSENIKKIEKPIEKEVYDYSSINELISHNTMPKKPRIVKDNIKNILLTGSTGYMGSHILDFILKNTRSNVYCLIRSKNNTDPQTRLLDTLRFYFGNKYDKLIFKRIFAVEGDITKAKLGLNNLYYNELGNSINCVINSAAIVKHYGKASLFNDTNILGTQNIVDFCKNFNCKLIHLSTTSVSGNIFNDTALNNSENIKFSEKDLYINQDLSNVYIKTKFLAERLILENIIKEKLNAKIIRLGNITNRYSDGAFQHNVTENAFLNRIHSFIQIGCVPMSLKNLPIEFSPVDICANAIVNLAKYKNPFTIFHIFNTNSITFEKLVQILKSFDINLEFVEDNMFNKKIKTLSKNEETKHIISGIVNDFSRNGKIEYVTNITMENSFTNNYLKRMLFKWPKINEKYISKYIKYLKSIKYI